MNGLLAWRDEAAVGAVNMAADELLAAEAVRRDRPLVRIYGWREPTVSLGGFQRLGDAQAFPGIAGLPIVRRPSGGGAIIHGSDVTYAVAVPRSHAWGGDPQVLYDAFHEALVEVLRKQGITASLHPGRGRDAGDEDRFLCFDRRARGDLVVRTADSADDHKILGSAQRRLQAAVLQHGSLLEQSSRAVTEDARHPGLHDLLASAGWGSTANDLVDPWLLRVAAAAGLRLEWTGESFLATHRPEITAAAPRFLSQAWLGRR